MRTERLNNVPPVPRTLAGLANGLADYPPVRNYYRGCARGTDGSIGLVFIHDSMLEPLSRCRQLYADGTFKIRPRKPHCAQVFIVHFRKMNTGFPAIYVLASSRTTAMYNAIWDKVFEIVPKKKCPVMGDFERSHINSGREKCPTATISGCEFHYKQALAKSWNENIPMEFEYILERAYAVAHLPPDKVGEGFMHITSFVDNLANGNGVNPAILQKLQDFAAYLRRYWLPFAEVLSVFQKPVRSNNTCKNFHLYAAKKMEIRSNVYRMLDGMGAQMGKTAANYEMAERGLILTVQRPARLVEADLAIQQTENEFLLGRYDVEEYLTHIPGLRRYHFARVHEYNERIRQPQRRANEQHEEDEEEKEEEDEEDEQEDNEDNVHFEINDIAYLRNELNPDAGPVCNVCYSREHLHKLPTCPHRICNNCIRNLIKRECPNCRTPITTYLPEHMMGGEVWNQNIPAQLQHEFYEQLLRDIEEMYSNSDIDLSDIND
ncbi:uncharacterized protein LOC107981407 [Nasonia vitripennis]|uniref:RING-type domain-containing protein n=1 Tax=Nasonia vitripennis TaxID=7425 RepID=A0A7M7QCS9_NASVI|nr:uncharacterized protein LOC107981407 [Nasonia vitripennis]